jgi:hypothetical protein
MSGQVEPVKITITVNEDGTGDFLWECGNNVFGYPLTEITLKQVVVRHPDRATVGPGMTANDFMDLPKSQKGMTLSISAYAPPRE